MNIIVFRQWFNQKIYPLLFSLCIIVSLSAFLTLDALQDSVDEYVIANQKQIVGGDLILTHNQAWPQDLLEVINNIGDEFIVYDYQFNAITYTEENSLLTRIKAVSSAYPLYGDLQLSKAKNLWPKGSVLVEKQVLSSLNLTLGDTIKIGEASFMIHDEIITEPDRPLTAFGFGARVIMHDDDLEKTALMGQKSRVNYRIEIKTQEQNTNVIAKQLQDLVKGTEINFTTAESSNTSIANLSQNFLIFLKLLVVAVIILSAIGIMTIIKAFVNGQNKTNAIRSALGEKSQSIIQSYRLLFTLMAVVSTLLAWGLSSLVLYFSKDIFSALLPNNITLSIGMMSLFKAFLIALVLTLLMSYVSLKNIKKIKPTAALHEHEITIKQSKKQWFFYLVVGFGCFGLLFSELNNTVRSLQILMGFALIWILFSLLTKALMWTLKLLLKKRIVSQWRFVLALQNIFRKGNQSNLFITSLSITTMVLGSITILDHSIQQQLISTYPEDAPNFFLLDVQVDQQDELEEIFEDKLTYFPVIRARIDSVNGVKTDVLKEKLGRYDNLTRMFNLSYADEILPTEQLDSSTNKDQLFTTTDKGYVPVSILNSFAEFLQVELGDEVVFNVQGIKIKSKISSIRKRLKRGPSPFFYFIFQPQTMKDAPQIRFATAKVNDTERIELQTEVAKKYPGITTLDGGAIAKKLKEFVDQLTQLVQIFTALSLFAGVLIFLTSLVSTSQDRMRESFYYKMMGMQSKDMLKLNIIEFQTLGLFAFMLGVLVATITSSMIIVYWFSLSFIFPWKLLMWSLITLCLILFIISYVYNSFVSKAKVVDYLRYE